MYTRVRTHWRSSVKRHPCVKSYRNEGCQCKRNVNIVGKNLTAQKMTADIAVTNAAVVDIAVKAREAGMTYGQYVAKMGDTDHEEKHKKI